MLPSRTVAALILTTIVTLAGCSTNSSPSETIPDDPLYPQQWALPAISAPAGWSIQNSSNALRIAVIDTGANAITDLAPNLVSQVACTPNCQPAPSSDRSGHGTSVASLIGAVGDNGLGMTGVSWAAQLVSLNVADSTGRPTVGAIVHAINWARANDIRLVNMSLTFGGWQPGVERAIAASPGTVFVVPADNDGTDLDRAGLLRYPCSSQSPHVLCVGGTAAPGVRDPSSNFGQKVDVYAPSSRLLTYDQLGRTVFVNGTSFATALVTGTVALMWARNPGLNPTEIAATIVRTSTPLAVDPVPSTSSSSPSRATVRGQLDLAAAVRAVDSG